MSLFDELKRRNVFRVGIAYLVGGWLLLQLTEVLSELLKLPEQVGPVVVSIVIIGLPIALFFAWAFELTPEGVKREKDVDRNQSITPQTGKKLNNTILVLMALAIAYLLFDKFSEKGPEPLSRESSAEVNDAGNGNADSTQVEVESVISRQSIAVLPFDNRSDQKSDEYFVEGIHDDLLTNLARIGSLKVISRTSMTQYKETEKTIPQIAGELGVATIMEGAVQRSGNTVRINVQLIDAQTDEHLWAEIFDRELTAENLFSIQTEISRSIAEALKATLSSEEELQIERRPTENLAAYNAYLRGRHAMARRNSESLQSALYEYRRAVELDPQFSLAWVGVAEATNLSGLYGDLNPDDRRILTQEAANRALAIDPTLGEAYVSLGAIYSLNHEFDQAKQAYQRAIELSPNYATAYHWYSTLLRNWRTRSREALEMSAKAQELDPLSSIIRTDAAELRIFLGDYERARLLLREVIDLDPDFVPVYSTLAELELEHGRYDRFTEWNSIALGKDPHSVANLVERYFTLLELGLDEQSGQVRETIENIKNDHASLLFMAAFSSVLNGTQTATIENANFLASKLAFPWGQFQAGVAHGFAESYDRARELMVSAYPGYLDPEQWQDLLERYDDQVCMAGFVLTRTGDEELGRKLLQKAVTYLQETLPLHIKHADRFRISHCYAALGNVDDTIISAQAMVEDNHIGGWKFLTSWPAMRLVADHPRFIALDQTVTAELARQAELVITLLEAEAGP
jgi:TolB-like protein/cytochrome c-type biogenesis protein CcmH/NrfG